MDSEQGRIEFIWRYLLPFGIGTVLMAAVNKSILVLVFQQFYPPDTWTYIRLCIHPLIAVIQEPLTSKFLPAALITLLAERGGYTSFLRENFLKLGVLGGLTVGIVEAGSKMLGQIAIIPIAILPIVLHVITGALVSSALFRFAGQQRVVRAGLVMIGGYFSAVIIHLFWNSQVVFWITGQNPC